MDLSSLVAPALHSRNQMTWREPVSRVEPTDVTRPEPRLTWMRLLLTLARRRPA